MSNIKRQILHIDMNSYFATVEQQANPSLRGKPVGVKGSKAKRTIIAAASIEAKKFGVKTGMREHEALEICPDLIVVVGEPRKYSDVTRRFIEIFGRYTDKVEIFSIDEAFLDITDSAHLFGGPKEVALKIKKDIRSEIGSWISCSVGLSSNKFLAKLGSDLEKPDGLVVIDENNKDEILLGCKLTDFCGIAHRIESRLNRMGITTVKDLREADDYNLKKEFGVYGLKLKRMAWGLDNSEVLDWHNQSDAKSFGHSRTLNKDVTKRAEIEKHLYLLSQKVAKRMRNEDFYGKEVGLWLRFKDFSGTGKRHRVGYWINDGYDIFKYALKILDEVYFNCHSGLDPESRKYRRLDSYWSSSDWIPASAGMTKVGGNSRKGLPPVRAMGVYVTRVSKSVPISLLPEEKKKEKMISTMDQINNRFGEDVLFPGTLVDIKLKEIVSGMGRKKF